jgi:hypothetical protein
MQHNWHTGSTKNGSCHMNDSELCWVGCMHFGTQKNSLPIHHWKHSFRLLPTTSVHDGTYILSPHVQQSPILLRYHFLCSFLISFKCVTISTFVFVSYTSLSLSQSHVTAVSQSVCQCVEPTMGLVARYYILSEGWLSESCLCSAPSLTRGRTCHLSFSVCINLSAITSSIYVSCVLQFSNLYTIYTKLLSVPFQYSNYALLVIISSNYHSSLDTWKVTFLPTELFKTSDFAHESW